MDEKRDLVAKTEGEISEKQEIIDKESLGSVCAGTIVEIAADASLGPEVRLKAAKIGLEVETQRQNLAYQSYENDRERQFKATEGDKDREERSQVRSEEAELMKCEMESRERENENERQFQAEENDKERAHEERMSKLRKKCETVIALIRKPISIIIIVAIIAGGVWAIVHYTKVTVNEVIIGMIVPPNSSKELKGKNWENVYDAFLERGFVNVEAIPKYDGKTGLFDTGWIWGTDQEVYEITIDGLTEFEFNDQFMPDAKVTIRYHVDSDKDPEKVK